MAPRHATAERGGDIDLLILTSAPRFETARQAYFCRGGVCAFAATVEDHMTVEPLLADSQATLRAALELVFASAASCVPFAPGRMYSPQEREPYGGRSLTSATAGEAAHHRRERVGAGAASCGRFT